MRILLLFFFAGAFNTAYAQCCCGDFHFDLHYPFEEFGPPTTIEILFYNHSYELNHKERSTLIPDTLGNFPIHLDLDCGYRLIELTIQRSSETMVLTLYNSPEVSYHLGSLDFKPGIHEVYIPDLLEDIRLLQGEDQLNLNEYVISSSEAPTARLFEYAYLVGSKHEFLSFKIIPDRHLRKEWVNYGAAEMEIQKWFRTGWEKIASCQLKEGQERMDWNVGQRGRYRMVLITKYQRVIYTDFIL